MAKRTTAISVLKADDWKQIHDAVNEIEDNPAVRRRDFSFGALTVLVYRAGTVVRVDFKTTG
jgi:hypothetical protein